VLEKISVHTPWVKDVGSYPCNNKRYTKKQFIKELFEPKSIFAFHSKLPVQAGII